MDFPFLFSMQVESGQILTVNIENEDQYNAALSADRSSDIFRNSQKGGPGSGGARPGAGRKPGSGAGGGGVIEPTQQERDLVNQEWNDTYSFMGQTIEDPEGIGQEEAKAIRMYASSRYGELNKNLRNGTPTEGDKAVQRLMDYGISKLPVDQVSVVSDGYQAIFRGVSAPAGEDPVAWAKSKFKEGEIFSDKGYMSSTTFQSVAKDFAGRADGIVLYIGGKTGRSIRGYTSRSYENEVVFPRSSNFKVTGVEERRFVGGSNEISVYMDEVHSSTKGYRDFVQALDASEVPFHELMDKYGGLSGGHKPRIQHQ